MVKCHLVDFLQGVSEVIAVICDLEKQLQNSMSCRHSALETNTLEELILLYSDVILEVILTVLDIRFLDFINVIEEQIGYFVIDILVDVDNLVRVTFGHYVLLEQVKLGLIELHGKSQDDQSCNGPSFAFLMNLWLCDLIEEGIKVLEKEGHGGLSEVILTYDMYYVFYSRYYINVLSFSSEN